MYITINKKQYKLPSGYATMRWAQYLKIHDVVTDIELLHRLTDVPLDELNKATDIEAFNRAMLLLSFLKEPVPQEKKPELYLLSQSKTLMFPKNFNEVTLGQYEDMKQILASEMATLDKVTKIVAIGATFHLVGDYSLKHLDKVEARVMECSVQSVIATYNFFLTKLNLSKNGTPNTVRRAITAMRNAWQALMSWMHTAF